MQATPLRPVSRRLWHEWIRPLVLPFLVITAAKSAIADINPVPTGSMKPTVLEGDVVFVNKLAYDLKVPFTTVHLAQWADPARGDVVVCFEPVKGTRLLKRIVGLPGDTIALRNETVFINGTPLRYSPLATEPAAEPRGVRALDSGERSAALFAREQLGTHSHLVMILPRRPALRTFGPLTIPTSSYFVMGDNRDNSEDSRFFGAVSRDQIVGRAQGVFVSGDLAHWLRPRFERFFSVLD
ncbi:MAG TPA: signal peptidase I [Opitutus sp.]|nr:signal peptidase I [Opitutus sp.]